MSSVRDTCGIDAVLNRLDLGRLDWSAASVVNGRNDNWLGTTSTGRRIFVKKLVGSADEVANGQRRTEAFYRTHQGAGALRTTTLIGLDDHASVQVFACLDGARNGQQTAVDNGFDHALAAEAGAALGALHVIDPVNLIAAEQSLPTLADKNPLRGLSLDVLYESSQAQLEAWRMIQQDAVVVEALEELERSATLCPVHGDLRLDQFLVADGRLYLTDWERFQLSDPAHDVGSFVGEWLHHAVVQFLGDRVRSSPGRLHLPPTIVLGANRPPWNQVRPVVQAFWHAYSATQPNLSDDFAYRATLFASWHLLERMLMGAQSRARLDGTALTLFRLARTILLRPGQFIPVLGLEDDA